MPLQTLHPASSAWLRSALCVIALTALTLADQAEAQRRSGRRRSPQAARETAGEPLLEPARFQERIDRVVARVVPATVGVRVDGRSGSGIIALAPTNTSSTSMS